LFYQLISYPFYIVGNICRSPIAEAIFTNEMHKRGLLNEWKVDSAALVEYHIGKAPDRRTLNTLRENGITNYCHRVRKVRFHD